MTDYVSVELATAICTAAIPRLPQYQKKYREWARKYAQQALAQVRQGSPIVEPDINNRTSYDSVLDDRKREMREACKKSNARDPILPLQLLTLLRDGFTAPIYLNSASYSAPQAIESTKSSHDPIPPLDIARRGDLWRLVYGTSNASQSIVVLLYEKPDKESAVDDGDIAPGYYQVEHRRAVSCQDPPSKAPDYQWRSRRSTTGQDYEPRSKPSEEPIDTHIYRQMLQ